MISTTCKQAGAEHGRILAICALAWVVVLLMSGGAARADSVIGASGAGAGQYGNPRSVAVDNSTGLVYVADKGNNRVDVFDASGEFVEAFGWGVADGISAAPQTCVVTCFAGLAGTGAGQFRAIEGIAVDNDPASPSEHDVYVLDAGNGRVQKFTPTGEFIWAVGGKVDKTSGANLCTAASAHICGTGSEGFEEGQFQSPTGIATGPGGSVYVTDERSEGQASGSSETQYAKRVQKYAPTGVEEADVSLSGGLIGPTLAFTVDSTGDMYTGTGGGEGAVNKYDPTGALIDRFQHSFNINALALDAADDLFVADNSGASAVYEYDASGTLRSVIYGTLSRRVTGLAIHRSATGDILAVEEGRFPTGSGVVYMPFPTPGPIVFKDTPGTVGNVSATLQTSLNPEGASTTVHFQYVDQADFEHEGQGFSSPATRSTLESAALGSDYAEYSSSVEIPCAVPGQPGCLQPQTTYRFRVVATNSEGSSIGPEGQFTTLPPIELGPSWATAVGAEEATLHASVNPLGVLAGGYLQYVSDATYRQDIAQAGVGHGFDHAVDVPDVAHGASPFSFGAGLAQSQQSVRLGSLTPQAAYHYRYLASDFFGEYVGPEHTFTTTAPPLQQASADSCPNAEMRVGPSAALPDCRAYEMVSPVDKQGADVITSFSGSTSKPARLDQAASNGERVTFSSYRAFANPQAAPFTSQYMAVRDASGGWSDESISPPEEGTDELELGGDHDGNYKAFSEDLCDGWILKGTEPLLDPEAVSGFANLYHRSDCGSGGYTTLTKGKPVGVNHGINDSPFVPSIKGFSSDGSRAFFDVAGKLVAGASTEPQAYESYEGALRLVCYLPNGRAATGPCTVGSGSDTTYNFEDSVNHAVSTDGSKVYWTGAEGMFVRLNPDRPQSALHAGQCTEPQAACTLQVASKGAFFLSASADGTRVLYTEGFVFGGEAKLYEGELQQTSAGTVLHTRQIDGQDWGVMGSSEDGSLVYIASGEVLSTQPNDSGQTAQSGQPNLYLFNAAQDSYAFIATFSLEDLRRQAETFSTRPVDESPYYRSSRVSPDGLHALFMSGASLTGYDNLDQQSGDPDAEVFLYSAAGTAGAPGKLRCVSCQVSGARPSGRNVNEVGAANWVAAQIPGWEYDLHPSRVLSADGDRVFFNSFDALLPNDTNGAEDVYEWEPGESQEQCEALGAEQYLAREGGCLSLISTGESPADSVFVDASRDGSDAFFTTGSDLVPQDTGGGIDIYDARVDGGFPAPPTAPPECEGEACQDSPAPPIELTPASMVFSGSGNPVPPAPAAQSKAKAKPKAKRCSKGRVEKKGKCVKKPKSKPKKRKAKRAARRAAKGRK